MTDKPEIYVGQSVIASWLGVTSAAVSNWITARHSTSVPAPDVVIATVSGDEVLGWSPDRRAEWLEWHRGQHALKPRPKRTRYVTETDLRGWR